MREAFDMLRGTLLTKGEQHLEFAQHLVDDVVAPLEALSQPLEERAEALLAGARGAVAEYNAVREEYERAHRRMLHFEALERDLGADMAEAAERRARRSTRSASWTAGGTGAGAARAARPTRSSVPPAARATHMLPERERPRGWVHVGPRLRPRGGHGRGRPSVRVPTDRPLRPRGPPPRL